MAKNLLITNYIVFRKRSDIITETYEAQIRFPRTGVWRINPQEKVKYITFCYLDSLKCHRPYSDKLSKMRLMIPLWTEGMKCVIMCLERLYITSNLRWNATRIIIWL